MSATEAELLGRAIRDARLAAGLSQHQLAHALAAHGITGIGGNNGIVRIEAGNRKVGFREGIILAQILGIFPEQLITPDGDAVMVADWVKVRNDYTAALVKLTEAAREYAVRGLALKHLYDAGYLNAVKSSSEFDSPAYVERELAKVNADGVGEIARVAAMSAFDSHAGWVQAAGDE